MAGKIKNSSNTKEGSSIERDYTVDKERSGKNDKEIIEKSREVGKGLSEVVEGAESVEGVETTGEVSEKSGEGRNKASSGLGKGSGASMGDIKKEPPPSIEIMRIQVSTQIRKEIRLLEKEAARLMRSPGSFHPFKLNMIVAKIRELKDILSGLAYATAETMKTWWMRFVKGITS